MADETTPEQEPEMTADVSVEVTAIDVDGDGAPDIVQVVSTTLIDVDGDGVPDAVGVVEAIGVDVDGDGVIDDDEIEVTEAVFVRGEDDAEA
jgi:hypothetical protein